MIPDDLYRRILESVPLVCVDVAIVQGGAVLLVKRAAPPAEGQWWLPGGRVLKGERLRQAARRKALGEVGLDCHVGPVVHAAETIFDDGPFGVPVHSVNTCFLLWPRMPQDVRLDALHADFSWCSNPSDFWENSERIELHQYVLNCLKGAGL